MNPALFKLGRTLFGIPFIIFGIHHLTNGSAMAGIVPIPGGVFWVYLTGFAHLAAGICFLMGKYVRLAGQLLAIMLVIFILSIHLPSAWGGDQSSFTNLLKDLALAGGALAIAGAYPRETSRGGRLA